MSAKEIDSKYIELQNKIFDYTNYKCHTCFIKILSYSQYNNCIKVKNFISKLIKYETNILLI